MKNIRLYALLALLLMAGGAFAQSFTSVCETGQNLQYAVTSVDPPEVTVERCLDYFGGVTIPDTVEYDNTKYAVVAIGYHSFMDGCASMNFSGPLVIPNTVREIGARAFWDCWFTGPLVIPNSVQTIGEYAFFRCKKFTSLTLSESLTYIEESCFDECDNMRGDLIIPESVVDVASYGFSRCAFDGVLSLSPNMRYVMHSSFVELFNITAIEIPEGVEFIDWMALDFLHKPTALELPSSLSYIEDLAFCNLFNLEQMTVNASVPPIIWDETFKQVNRDIPIYIPVGTLEAYQNAQYWSEFTNFIEKEGVGVGEHNDVPSVFVYPNPTADRVHIEGFEPNEVQVYDAIGRLLKTVQGAKEISLGVFPKGVYLLRITDAEGRIRTARVTVKE